MTVKVSTMYIPSNLLINAKISLASFMHDCIDRFRFPNKQTSKIDANYKIIKVLPYLLMKDTDSCSLEIILIPADSYDCCETEIRDPYLLMKDTDSCSLEIIVIPADSYDCCETEIKDVLLRIFLDSKIHLRLNLSGEFFERFGKRNNSIRKQVALSEFENIEHSIICRICVNPKEYFQLCGILYETNKKHMGVKKGTK